MPRGLAAIEHTKGPSLQEHVGLRAPVHSSSAWLPRWTTIDRRLPHDTFNFRVVLSYVLHGSVDPSEMALGGLFRLIDGVIYEEPVRGQWSNPIWAFLAVAAWEQSTWG